jgi:hypothetical protein
MQFDFRSIFETSSCVRKKLSGLFEGLRVTKRERKADKGTLIIILMFFATSEKKYGIEKYQ